MPAETEIIVKDGNYIRRTITKTVVEENLGPQPQLTKETVRRDLLVVPDAFSVKIPTAENYIANKPKMEIPIPCHIGILNTALHVAHRLPYWPLNGGFKKDEQMEFIDGEEKAVEILSYTGKGKDTYLVPVPYPGLWMVYAFQVNVKTMRLVNMSSVFLLTNIRGKFYAPLLPNIFDNSQVCLGDIRFPGHRDVARCTTEIFESLFFSKDNDHLLQTRTYDTLRFRKDDLTWIIPDAMKRNPETWHSGRSATVAAEMLQHLHKIEEGEGSPKFKA